MKAYCERVLRAVALGCPRAEIVHLFGVSLATLKRYLKPRREEGHVRPNAIAGRPPKKRAEAGGWCVAPITGTRRRYPGTTLCDVGTDPR